MPAVPLTIDGAADLVDLSIQKIFKKTTNLEEENYKKYYHVEQTDDYYDKDSSLSGFGEASRMTENAIITSESPVQGYDKTYTQVFHGKMGQFTLYEWKYGIKKRKLESVVNDLRKACERKREYTTTSYLENSIGANTTYTISDDSGNYTKSVVGGDGVALINSSHTREDGGTAWSNVITDGTTSNMDFDLDGLKAAFRTASLIRDPKGNLMNVRLDTLVCRRGSTVFFEAMEINGALKKNLKPQSADRDGSPFGAFNIVDLPYLSTTGQDYWWMFDSSAKGSESGLQVRESEGIVLDKAHADYKTKTIYVSSHFAFDYGHNDGRCWVGSDGTNA